MPVPSNWTFGEDWFWCRQVRWRVSHLLVHEDGPAAIVARLRRWLGDRFWLGCSTVSTVRASGLRNPSRYSSAVHRLTGWLRGIAISGAACLLEGIHGEPLVIERLRKAQENKKMPCCGQNRAEIKKKMTS